MNRKVFGIPLPILIVVGLIVLVGGAVLTFAAGQALYQMIEAGGHNNPVMCERSEGCAFWQPIIYSALFLFIVVTGFAYTTLLERKYIAWFQQRVGPNRVGPGGLLQPAADGLKLIFKEDIMPAKAYKWVYRIAPMLKAVPVLIVMAVTPLGPRITLPWFDGVWYNVPLYVSNISVGVLWILAVTSIATYGVALAGWSSNNKYAMLGALRASAQMISYELSLGLALIVPVMLAGSMSVVDIIEAQAGSPLNWFVFQNPLAAGILIIALIAETNRAPFDLPEAEQELTAGYMTEYSGMKFALFMMAEYLGMIATSMIAMSMFFGGYHFFLVETAPILGVVVMIAKVVLCLIGFVWIRATLPRIRYDRLMSFGWKVMLPLALLSVLWTMIAVVIGDAFGPVGYAIVSGAMFVLLIAGAYFLFGRDKASEEEPDVDDDPIITGERRGLGYATLQVVGGVLAVPFVLYNSGLKLLDRLSSLAPEDTKKTPPSDGSAD
jgi:NADH-quinone oxidoreductase subunit H